MKTSAMRRATMRSALLLGSVLVTLLALEIGFRLFDVRPDLPPPRHVEVLGPDGRYSTVGLWGTAPLKRPSSIPGIGMGEYVPGRNFRFVYYDDVRDAGKPALAARTAVASINSHGLRGEEFESAKPDGTRRILFIGDSFTFGEGVNDDEPFPALLQQRFDSRSSDDSGYQVINAGISGYNTRDEVLNLEHRWLEFGPDLVLLVFYLNDAYDDGRFADLIRGAGEGRLAEATESRSRLLGYAGTRLARWRAGRQVTEIYRAQFSGQPAIEGHDWEGSKLALSRAAELTREREIPFAVVLFPELYALDDSHPFAEIYEQVESHVESLGIPVLNLFPAYRGHDARDLWVHTTDHHPNEEAHRIAAEAIWSFLRDSDTRLLP